MNSVANVIIPAHPISTSSCPSHSYLTDAKIQKIVLAAFAALSVFIGVTMVSLAASTVIAWPLGFISIPFFATSVGCCIGAWKIRDYDNPTELAQMKKQAEQLAFSKIVQMHGLDHIKRHEILSFEQLQKKFAEENETKTLSNMISKWSLSTIVQYDLMPVEKLRTKWISELSRFTVGEFLQAFPNWQACHQFKMVKDKEALFFKDLETQYFAAKDKMNSQLAQADFQFPRRMNRLIAQLDIEKNNAYRRANERKDDLEMAAFHIANYRASHFRPDPRKSSGENWYDRWERRREIEYIAKAPAQFISDQILQQELDKLNFEIRSIQLQGIGREDQLSYERETERVRQTYEETISKLSISFRDFIKEIEAV